jgi:SAM-dependent methyltransferase
MPEGRNGVRIRKDRWNHNIHYGLEVLELVPATATDALDVGCGDGWMVRQLSHRVPRVVGLDPDEASISLARGFASHAAVEYVEGDLLTYRVEPSSFDFITCIAALHHMDEQAGMRRMAELLRPGGTLASSVSPEVVSRQICGGSSPERSPPEPTRSPSDTGRHQRPSCGHRPIPTPRSVKWPRSSCPAAGSAGAPCGVTS